jgi:trimeric autotransporter adhesin
VVWSRGAGDPATYTTLSAFQSATGQEKSGQLINGTGAVDPNGTVTASMTNTAQPLPAAVAAATGLSAGARRLGAWPA